MAENTIFATGWSNNHQDLLDIEISQDNNGTKFIFDKIPIPFSDQIYDDQILVFRKN